jgi:hypothetical protein
MKIEQAVQILEEHQKWRKGIIDDTSYSSKELSEAIDIIIKYYKKK